VELGLFKGIKKMKYIYRIILLIPLILSAFVAMGFFMWGLSSRKVDKMPIGRFVGWMAGKMEID